MLELLINKTKVIKESFQRKPASFTKVFSMGTKFAAKALKAYCLMSSIKVPHARNNSLYISLPLDAKQQEHQKYRELYPAKTNLFYLEHYLTVFIECS